MPQLPNVDDNDLIDDAIAGLLHLAGASGESATGDADIYGELLRTITGLVHDRADRGEIKILNAALKEMRHAFRVFRDYTDFPKVSIFGSARLTRDDAAYAHTVEFARRIAEAGWMVITGAGPGIMEAGVEGAGAEHSFGVNIRLPFEQSANELIRADAKLINFKYFFTRKLFFVKEASAICLLPGGFGTLDEGFETLTLVQTGKANPVPMVLLDTAESDYWEMWRLFVRKELLGRGLISKDDQSLYFIAKDPAVAVAHILHFYSNYHSCRYVRDKLVIRLTRAPEAGVLAELNKDFKDLLEAGRFESIGPLPDELATEPADVLALPRIAFKFNRINFGRLRELVDRLNDIS